MHGSSISDTAAVFDDVTHSGTAGFDATAFLRPIQFEGAKAPVAIGSAGRVFLALQRRVQDRLDGVRHRVK